MNTNSIYQIGKDHIVCEDYALADTFGGLSYAIVSDGCSASNDVDMGARAVAMSAKRVIRLGGTTFSPERFGDNVIRNAERIVDVFPYLSRTCLDATLLAAWVEDKKLTAYLYGDGVFIHKTKDALKLTHINITSGAPDYLSYTLDPQRQDCYNNIKDNRKVVWTSYNGTWDNQPLYPVVIQSPVEEGDVIAVISDGINSFRKHDSTPIDWKDMVDEFIGFKQTEGEFVIRRISAFKRKCLKDGTVHTDDISMAAIIV